jgi:hypothetical protein
MLERHKPGRTVSRIHPQRSNADPQRSQAEQNQRWAPGGRYPNTGLLLIDTPHRSNPRPPSRPERPWFPIAAGLLCWLVAGLLIIQL